MPRDTPFAAAGVGTKRKAAVIDVVDDDDDAHGTARVHKRPTPWWPSGVTPTAPTTTAKTTTTTPSAAIARAGVSGGGASSSGAFGGAASNGGGDDDDATAADRDDDDDAPGGGGGGGGGEACARPGAKIRKDGQLDERSKQNRGSAHRKWWSFEEKSSVLYDLASALQEGGSQEDVATRHGISPGQLSTLKKQAEKSMPPPATRGGVGSQTPQA